MECGIVGLQGVGKTSLFNALTGAHAAAFAGADKPNVGVAHIPDSRLQTIAQLVKSKTIVPDSIRFVDIPGVPIGSDSGTSKLGVLLGHIREVDAICHVVRCFDGGLGTPEPANDIERMETELILADLQVVENALDRASRTARSGEAEAKARVAVLTKANELLNESKAIRSHDAWSDAERAILKNYGMITAKPLLFVANVGEDDIAGASVHVKVVDDYAKSTGTDAVAICAKLESEIAELPEADRQEMMTSMGVEKSAIESFSLAMCRVLGLICFFTAGERETRARLVRKGSTAPEAAGIVHSDMQRGFIRAERYHMNDLVQYKSEKALKEAGKLHMEGKNYIVQEGDVLLFLFNV